MSEHSQSPECLIELVAGRHPNGELVMEKLLVTPQGDNSYRLLKSPVFVRGIARDDVVQQMDQPQGAFKVLQHGGNLCIRIFGKQKLATLQQSLTHELEKLGGDLDIAEDFLLVYSIHVSCGFKAIEKLLDSQLAGQADVIWQYGNVYDPVSGEPLNWWQPILAEK